MEKAKKESLIIAKEVTVIRNNNIILDNVSVSVEKKDFLTIIGPNGAGKSMLLGCLMGYVEIQKGWIKKKKDLKIGYVPQSISLDRTMPLEVKRFITLRKKVKKLVLDEIVEETNIGNILSRSFLELSGGEKQRVILARGLMDNPDLLVLDEPAQNLDMAMQLTFYKLIDKLYHNRDISIVMVSHDLHLVMSSTKRVICLAGSICCAGKAEDVKKDHAFRTAFGKDYGTMMKAYYHDHYKVDEEEKKNGK